MNVDTAETADLQAKLYRTTVRELMAPSPSDRGDYLNYPPTPRAHGEAFAKLDVLRRIEVNTAGLSETPGERAVDGADTRLRVAFWNAERCKYVAESAALLQSLDVDVVLLAEMDLGMARSGQHNTTRALAEALGYGYVFGPEFVELGLGDKRERKWFAGAVNSSGIHGGALLSRIPFTEPALIRLPEFGDWFDGRRGERRIGGRVVVAAKIAIGSTPLVLAAAHFESHGNPTSRQSEVTALLPALEAYAREAPIILGGDFNTNSTERDVEDWDTIRDRLEAETPGRLANPVDYEPMFDVLAASGFEWRTCNAPGVTQRTRPDGTPTPPFARLDWFFSRDIRASNPEIRAALSPADGTPISDHEVLVVEIGT